MCLMCAHIAAWYFLRGKASIPESCIKKKEPRVQPNKEGDMIPKRKKVKAPRPGNNFPKRKAAKKRSATTFFGDEVRALSNDDQILESGRSDSEDDEQVIVVDDSPIISQNLST